jgi:hypothetical protein
LSAICLSSQETASLSVWSGIVPLSPAHTTSPAAPCSRPHLVIPFQVGHSRGCAVGHCGPPPFCLFVGHLFLRSICSLFSLILIESLHLYFGLFLFLFLSSRVLLHALDVKSFVSDMHHIRFLGLWLVYSYFLHFIPQRGFNFESLSFS